MATGCIVAVAIVGIVALVLTNFAGRIEDEDITGDAEEGGSRSCKGGLSYVYSLIMKSFPLTGFKTVIVVWQIVTQVSSSPESASDAMCRRSVRFSRLWTTFTSRRECS